MSRKDKPPYEGRRYTVNQNKQNVSIKSSGFFFNLREVDQDFIISFRS